MQVRPLLREPNSRPDLSIVMASPFSIRRLWMMIAVPLCRLSSDDYDRALSSQAWPCLL